ncbi:MAG TPA: nucleotidyltransferase-like protein [Bacillus sp. (in: firmicutes)]|nr:nucleotidyltransferase-like protein [Bacillus sp. (in: firmicutes)]
MEDVLRPIYQERASNEGTLGIILIEKRKSESPVTDNLDAVILVIVKEAEQPLFVKHYEYKDETAGLCVVTDSLLRSWISNGTNRRVVDWLFNGKLLFDRNEYIESLKRRLQSFPYEDRLRKMGIEFAKLIRRFIEGKDFYDSKHYLDAFNHMVHALHHLGRLSILEHGFHPEIIVWNQVKKIEPQIYKLYEELVIGGESLEKRLELLFLAIEFLITERKESGSKHLVNVLIQKSEPWTFADILNHPEIKAYAIDLGVLLEFLVEKGIVSVHNVETKGKGLYHRYYYVETDTAE